MKKIYLLFSMLFTLLLFVAGTTFSSDYSKTDTFMSSAKSDYFILTDQSEDCNTETYKIYPEAAKMWNASWLDVFEQDTIDAVRTLTTADLDYLYKQYADVPNASHGLRFYYGLTGEGSEIPDLIIANTLECQYKADADNMVLLVTTEGSKTVSLYEARQYTDRWQEKSDLENWTSVYAYNYRWDQIKALVGENLNEPMHIVYGLRTLSPDENKTEFQRPEVDTTQKEVLFGSIVYVNVLYVGARDLALTNDDEQFDNFARPCPRFCDPDTINAPTYR
ncbi:MAG: hypothetical protein Roseis2KO_07700 [Roseivirga sp.]